MIHHTIPTWQALSWRDELKQLITDPEQLFALLDLDPAMLPDALKASDRFALRVTPSFAAKMVKGDRNDPLLQQVLPVGAELFSTKGFSNDPLAENNYNTQKGIVHKYRNRVLLITSTSCAINCRYCFRREFNYQEHRMGRNEWQAAIRYIYEHKELDEVILSGGDPLLLNDPALHTLLSELAEIPHLDTVRVHSRIPIVLPNRITPELINIFLNNRLNTVWVVHSNHANEIGIDVSEGFRLAQQAGISLLNQAVLLKNVNDSWQIQQKLAKALIANGVIPYYLHLLDRVSGAAHFDMDETAALSVFNDMRANMSGYLVPRLVREVAGDDSKRLHI